MEPLPMKMLNAFLEAMTIVLVVISSLSFATNNVADAIYYLVLTLWIEKRVERMDANEVSKGD